MSIERPNNRSGLIGSVEKLWTALTDKPRKTFVPQNLRQLQHRCKTMKGTGLFILHKLNGQETLIYHETSALTSGFGETWLRISE
ncbi:hypothetical protein CEXT_595091 [Caerostris extrusa]|uniref:Uncharacterized protein n=1 Tax=Caerostris extrusa TaxID=172846 RepID=A0AAV4PGF7_CAEEX|nr:hypothetical protein CEXT_595091 [Caerostris extrusa]